VIIGCTVGHDASVSFVSNSGEVIYAAAEERFSRVKGHLGAPYNALNAGINELNLKDKEILESQIVISGSSKMDANLDWFYFLLLDRRFQGKFDIFNQKLPPGLMLSLKKEMQNLDGTLEDKINTIFEKNFGFKIKRLIFINHHDAHASSAFWNSNFDECLVLTLDGSGDGECGSFRISNRSGYEKIINRFPEKYSIGHLYSEVTKRYGFRESKHEGKITGLAAYSKLTPSELSFENIYTKNFLCGFTPKYNLDPRLRNIRNLKDINSRAAMELAVSRAESRFQNFPDLAASVQLYAEDLILNFIRKQKENYKINKIALAGGVFSNVLVNGKIAEMDSKLEIYVYPNMGDGGLSVGAALEYLRLIEMPQEKKFKSNMYLGSQPNLDNSKLKTKSSKPVDLAEVILQGKIIGIVFDRMEFGPRALCHRSIIASPKNSEINSSLNRRLNRTEFMPFAPVVRDEDFDKVFCDSSGNEILNLKNFDFMTQTCHVRDEFRAIIPAVVHLDGTARPQILKRQDNPFLYEAMTILSEEYNLPVVINTSFNAHEEPIISNIDQAMECLRKKQIDILYCGSDQIIL
jgi:carbamoyltransferase